MTLPVRARVYLWLVALAAAGAPALWWRAWRGPGPTNLGLLALLVGLAAVAQHFPLEVGPRRKLDASAAVYFAGLLLVGAPAAMGLVGASQLLGQATLALRRSPATGQRLRTARSVVFNTGQAMLATGAGGLVYYALLPHAAPAPLERVENLWAIPAAAAAVYLANTGAVAVMVALQRGQHPAQVWLAGRRTDALEAAGLFSIGLVAALTAAQHPWALLVLALPAAILHRALGQTMRLLAREQAARAAAEAAAERVRRLQAAVEQERATLAAVAAGMSDGLIVLDAARRVHYCNARAGELLGIDPATIVGQSLETVMCRTASSLADPPAARALWERLATAPPEQASGELALLGPPRPDSRDDAPRREVLVSAFPVAGTPEASLGLLLRDVTGLKRLALLEDRERIAMGLHDDVIQSLYAVTVGLARQERLLDGRSGALRAALGAAIAQINDTIRTIRNYIFDLRPQEFRERGLGAGLAALAKELQINALLRTTLELDPAAEELLAPEALADLLAIAREATSNILRHAGASAVTIRLERAGGQLVLTIRDNGQGFDPQQGAARAGEGLRNMAERARALGGRLRLTSELGRGTEARVEVPAPARRVEDYEPARGEAAGRG